MKITLDLPDKLINQAIKLTGIKEKSDVIQLGLKTLITLECNKKLSQLGGTEKDLKGIKRPKFD